MIRIAVCDDDSITLDYNAFLLENYRSEKGLEAEIAKFSNPLELRQACETEPFQIYLLDMLMPEMNGVELGKRIREIDKEGQIIFLTADKGSALEAYDVNPLHYLIKPVDPENLARVMDLAVSKIPLPERKFTIRSKNGIYTVPVNEILCVEHTQRTAKFTLADGNSLESMTLSSGFSELTNPIANEEGFISPHNSFVVNMDYVQSLEKDGFVMKTGQFIPVAVRKQAMVKAAFIEYHQHKKKAK